MSSLQHHLHHSGPRERLSRLGAEALSDDELVAILLGTGSRGESVLTLASRVLRRSRGLTGLECFGVGQLAEISGVGSTKASRILAALEVGRRVLARPLQRGAALSSSRCVYEAFRPRLGRSVKEYFLAIPMDARNRPMGEIQLSVGGLTACPVLPADVFRALLREAAVSVIFIHNHPSNDPTPSEADIALTQRLCCCGKMLGIRVLDHVIIASNDYFSFADANYLDGKDTEEGSA